MGGLNLKSLIVTFQRRSSSKLGEPRPRSTGSPGRSRCSHSWTTERRTKSYLISVESGYTVTLFREDFSSFRDEALTKATLDAKRKATAIAKRGGVQIKEAVSFSEREVYESSFRSSRLSSGTSPTASSKLGELEITMQVTVKYSY